MSATTRAHDPLRPKSLAEFAGQPSLSRELNIVLSGAKARGELSPHLLFAGPPGLGKTTLAGIVAHELNLPIVSTSGPAVEKPADLAGLLVSLDTPSVVFIDEIHRLAPQAEELLYTAMEDGRIDLLVGEGPGRSRAIPMALEEFVLVGATTRAGMLSRPLRERFGYTGRLEMYDTLTLGSIVARSAHLLGVELSTSAAEIIASRSRGTPRVANMWLRRVRDVADGRGLDFINDDAACEALEVFGVDDLGLDKLDRAILTTLVTTFNGGPVGLNTLAANVGEEPGTLEEVHEPYLMRQGLLGRSPRGRVATAGTYRHLQLQVPASLTEGGQPTLLEPNEDAPAA